MANNSKTDALDTTKASEIKEGVLSEKQKEILDFMKSFYQENKYPPTVREICAAVDLKSTSSVHAHLTKLEKMGYIKKKADKPRAIAIEEASDSSSKKSSSKKSNSSNSDDEFNLNNREIVNVPVIGTVTAGEPILAVENITEYVPFLPDFLPNQQTFMLKVKGESMINIGILDGDFVIVAQGDTAKNGDVVVALVDDSATVKRFFKEDGHYRLQPENDYMDPIIVDTVSIIGKVVGLIRRTII